MLAVVVALSARIYKRAMKGSKSMGIEADFFDLIKQLNPYSKTMEFGHLPAPGLTAGGTSGNATAANIQVQIDNYKGEWSFRGGIEQIKRSLRVTYRYPILATDENGDVIYENGHPKETGLYATEHLLIGYAGGNH
jgi:hypothetical protein